MASFGKIAQTAAKRLAKLKKGDDGTAAAVSAPSVSRAPGPPPKPRGSDLGNDAKNVKIRQKYEESIPEAMTPRETTKKKSRWF